jgi:cyclase
LFKRRLIPVLFFKNGWMIRSEKFSIHQVIGDPVLHVERMKEWDVDELIILDISDNTTDYSHIRQDYKYKPVKNILGLINDLSKESHMPLTFGGNIRCLEDVEVRIRNGADKVAINSSFYLEPKFISEAINIYGKQAIVASIDYKLTKNGNYSVFINGGQNNLDITPELWSKELQKIGAGEILLQSIDKDGSSLGYDIDVINRVCNSVNIPVIACSGAGNHRHIRDCYNLSNAEAIAAGNVFHFTENSYPRFKIFLKKHIKEIR